nr:Dihydrofolate reductase [uncultured bacterium]
MILSHIVAAAQNGVIGTEGGLPWNIPEDMKFFKDKTKGHAMIMGRKTFESVGHPLPNRLNVVITRQTDFNANGATVVSSLDEAIEVCKQQTAKYGDEVFIIGGGEIYRQSMHIVDRIYLTRIYQDYDGDARYPEVDLDEFKEVSRQERTEPVPFTFLVFERKNRLH